MLNVCQKGSFIYVIVVFKCVNCKRYVFIFFGYWSELYQKEGKRICICLFIPVHWFIEKCREYYYTFMFMLISLCAPDPFSLNLLFYMILIIINIWHICQSVDWNDQFQTELKYRFFKQNIVIHTQTLEGLFIVCQCME